MVILTSTNKKQWRYVSTKDNPADQLSIGSFPSELLDNNFWFSGPSWLSSHENCWPSDDVFNHETLDEVVVLDENKTIAINTIENVLSPTEYLLDFCSGYIQLLRYTTWFRRFFLFLRNRNLVNTDHLSPVELASANVRWISFVQAHHFRKEIILVGNPNVTRRKNRFWKLNPILDQDNLLRVGGRLSYAEISFDEKHPFILPQNSHFSHLIVNHHHSLMLHAGTQLTLAETRRKYWILGGRNCVRKMIKNCLICARYKGQTATQLMADLPSARVTQCHRPFLHAGVDLCGPLTVRTSKKPGSKIYKGYVALFICMAV